MKAKRMLALVLTLCMALTLYACGGETYIEAYESSPALDFQAAWTKHAPEETMFYVDGEAVSWRELFYQTVYFFTAVSEAEGVSVSSWEQGCTLFSDADGNHVPYGTVVLQQAVRTLVQYHAVHKNLTDAGASLGPEAAESVARMRQTAIDENFGGDEQAFLDYLDSMYCTEELWTWFASVDALYAYDGFDTLYGVFGAALPDEDVLAYAAGDPGGQWSEYVQIKQLYLYNDTGDDENESEDASGEPMDEPEAGALADIEDVMSAQSQNETASIVFDALYGEYNENAALDVYEGGRCVYDGDVDDVIYHAALELEDYGWTTVRASDADVVVLRVPIRPDAGVFYDETDGTMYTLRYYAAWQAYSDRINGADGWIANAETEWVDGYGDFNLKDAFE